MIIPTTPLKLPIQGKPVDADGNWTPAWARTLQLLFNRVGAYTAPSNLQLASALGSFVAGPAAAVDSNIVVFDGITGKLVKDGGTQIAALAPLASPIFTGTPTTPTATAGTANLQVANTAFVGNAISGFGNVVGPASSISGNITVFNGATGKFIADGGVQLTALAPLASPALTGVPTAPTAAAGTNTTQVATTAFVAAASGLNASFSAHNNGVAQSIPNATFTKLTFSTKDFDIGSKFATSAWTPSAGKPVLITGAVALPTIAGAQSTSVSVYKNGVEFKRGNQSQSSSVSAVVCHVACIDIPNGTDIYELYVQQTSGVTQSTYGTSSVTYFQGTTLTP